MCVCVFCQAVSGAVVASGTQPGGPGMMRFTAPTIGSQVPWSFDGPIWVGQGRGRAECGDYFTLQNKTVLIFSSTRGYVVEWMVGAEDATGTL